MNLRALAPVPLTLLSLTLGWYLPLPGASSRANHAHGAPVALRTSGGPLTAPLLTCETQASAPGLDLPALHAVLDGAAAYARWSGTAASFSARFVDLGSGGATGIDEAQPYAPASLMKLVDLMTLLRRAEAEPGLLARTLTPTREAVKFHPTEAPRDPLQVGHAYTVEALAEHMIVQSDNVAVVALHDVLSFEEVRATLATLRVSMPEQPRPDSEFMTVDAYATLLEVLYNGTFLSPKLSEKALRWLSQADLGTALVSGAPAGVTVAHKFGERGLEDVAPERRQQFHDCGIVYHPRRPYVLCVMTRGAEEPALVEAVAETSRRVWAEVERQQSTPR